MIKCGNCHQGHERPSDVKACYSGQLVLAGAVRADTTVAPSPMTRTLPRNDQRGPALATTKQIDFLLRLMEERAIHPRLTRSDLEKFTRGEASASIESLLAKPVLRSTPGATVTAGAARRSLTAILTGVDDGYYAIPSKTGTNDLDFIRVGTNQGRENPANKGKRRVQRVLGGHGNISITYGEAIEFAEAIAALSPAERLAAQLTFGREIGRCGRCGKSLTDETSRTYGLGPDCRNKVG